MNKKKFETSDGHSKETNRKENKIILSDKSVYTCLNLWLKKEIIKGG